MRSAPGHLLLKIVRKSEAKADAAQQIMKKYDLDAEQTDAILELKIYRLARLEILVIRKELEDQINTLLKDESGRWDVVRVELEEIQKQYGDARRTAIASDEGEVEFFKLKDGEKIVGALSLDERAVGNIRTPTSRRAGSSDPAEPPVHAVAATSDGYALRFSLEPFVEPSTRSGRRFARMPEKAAVAGVERYTGDEILIAATRQAHAILTKAATDLACAQGNRSLRPLLPG